MTISTKIEASNWLAVCLGAAVAAGSVVAAVAALEYRRSLQVTPHRGSRSPSRAQDGPHGYRNNKSNGRARDQAFVEYTSGAREQVHQEREASQAASRTHQSHAEGPTGCSHPRERLNHASPGRANGSRRTHAASPRANATERPAASGLSGGHGGSPSVTHVHSIPSSPGSPVHATVKGTAAASTPGSTPLRIGSPPGRAPGFHVTTRTLPEHLHDGMLPPLHMMLNPGALGGQATNGSSLVTAQAEPDPRDRGRAIEEAAAKGDFPRVVTPEHTMTPEEESVCHQLVQALDLRWKWLFRPKWQPQHDQSDTEVAVASDVYDPWHYQKLPPSELSFRLVDGIYRIYAPRAQPAAAAAPEAAPSAPGDAHATALHTVESDTFAALAGDTFHPLPTAPEGAPREAGEEEVFPLPGTAREFFTDMSQLIRVGAAGPVKTYCHHRLMLLEQKFNLHVMLHGDKEVLALKSAPHRDFYNVRKVDTHVHHSACMHQKHLLRFIKAKLKKESDEIVIFRDGKFLTLLEVFESLNLTAYDLNVDTLDMHADKTIFHRFDRFNLKYNPFGQSRLREIFIKQDNLLHGRFLAELTQEVFSDLEDTKYQHTEYRISIYGRKSVEWDILAFWVCHNRLYSDKNVWLIQIPRLYHVYKEQGLLATFEEMLANIFRPLFEVTADPETHPQLHIFLQQVVGFDCVDDESKPERRPTKNMPSPAVWDNKYNPAYSYYMFYLYANLYTLNRFRESRGLNTFTFRPHCGEAGELDHLASCFMLCENIAHGIQLRKSPFLQYLYYLAQVGLCMSPLSNNSLFLDYQKSPFPMYFARGLSVSLSTDDPLQIHLTREPLVEEYSVAANMWKLTTADMCEIARNSVLHSGFPHVCKKHWLSTTYWRPGPEGNDIQKTNVPNLRVRFRWETHQDEIRLLYLGTALHAHHGGLGLRLD